MTKMDENCASEVQDSESDAKENVFADPSEDYEKRILDKIRVSTLKVQNKHLVRSVPRDVLTLDWLGSVARSSTPRLHTLEFLVNDVVPCVVLAMERLLAEATRRGVVEGDDEDEGRRRRRRRPEETNFNPVNFVAQFLMRHNPRFYGGGDGGGGNGTASRCAPASAGARYATSLREVASDLREELEQRALPPELRKKREDAAMVTRRVTMWM